MADEIYRIVKQDNFVVLDRRFLHSEHLSWKAKGILAYVLSLPNDWKFYIEELATHSTDGEKGLRTGWNELVKYGYINRVPSREGSRIKSWETQIFEHPSLNPLHDQKRKVDTPLLSGSVDVQKLHVQKDGLLSIDPLPSIDSKPSIDPFMSGKPDDTHILSEITEYLNRKTGSKYRWQTESTAKAIRARLKEGRSPEDFRTVIDKKTAEWKGTDMEQYLRPDTLFRPGKFESYLNQPWPKGAGANESDKSSGSSSGLSQFVIE